MGKILKQTAKNALLFYFLRSAIEFFRLLDKRDYVFFFVVKPDRSIYFCIFMFHVSAFVMGIQIRTSAQHIKTRNNSKYRIIINHKNNSTKPQKILIIHGQMRRYKIRLFFMERENSGDNWFSLSIKSSKFSLLHLYIFR